MATLGPSIVIKGNLSGEEDLRIEGRVEGEVQLQQHSVTIGESGRVKADVFSRNICVEGEVRGNLFGEEQVIIRQSGKVRGNVTAPRVTLENGAKFRGSIDMQPGSGAAAVTPSGASVKGSEGSAKSDERGKLAGSGRSAAASVSISKA